MSQTRSTEELCQQHFVWAEKALLALEGQKANIIQQLAYKCERDGMPVDRIAAEITRRLGDIVSPSYVRETLPSKFKQQSKVRTHDREVQEICATSGAKSAQSAVILHDGHPGKLGLASPCKIATNQDVGASSGTSSSVANDGSASFEFDAHSEIARMQKRIDELEGLVEPFTVKAELDAGDGNYIPLTVEVEPETKDVRVSIDRRRARSLG